MSYTPISEELIKNFLYRHVNRYYKIGDLYTIKTLTYRTYGSPTEIIVPLLDYTLQFEYEPYKKICEFGKSIPSYGVVVNNDVLKSYTVVFNYKFLNNNKVNSRQIMKSYNHPVVLTKTMNSFISSFAEECKKEISKYEPKDSG